jgi:hypothetical protein
VFAFFRRWRERKVRTCIALAVAEQLAYEAAHSARMETRLEKDASPRFLTHLQRHAAADLAAYTLAQRRIAIEQRVRAAYGKKQPPKNLTALIAEAVAHEEV